MNAQKQFNFAYVLSCGDPKIRRRLTLELDCRFGGPENYFWMPELGGVKDLVLPLDGGDTDRVLRKVVLAGKIHQFGLIILINHSGCGAYKNNGYVFDDPQKEESFHVEQLQKAEKILKRTFPNLLAERHYFLKEEQRLAW